MKKAGSHGLRSRVARLVALTLALVLIFGALPASAASNEIVVRTKKQLVKAMQQKSAATIIFRTNRKTKFIIPALENSANKKLVMEAPNAKAFNKATFKTITLKSSDSFNERGKDNSLYIKGDGITLTVSKGTEAKKVSISANDVLIKVSDNADAGDIILNKKDAEVKINVAKNAEANITVKKKADLIVSGDKTADVKVVSQAKNTKITASVPVDLVAEKKVDLVLEKGSEGSNVESAKGVDVDLSGEAEKNATVVQDGKTVQEAEKVEEKKEESTDKEKTTTPSTETETTTPSTDTTTTEPNNGTTQPTTPVTYRLTVDVVDGNLGTYAVAADGTTVASSSAITAGAELSVKLNAKDGCQGEVTVSDGYTATLSGDKWEITPVVKSDIMIKIVFSRKTVTPEPVVEPGTEPGTEPVTEPGTGTEVGTEAVILYAYVGVASGGSISVETAINIGVEPEVISVASMAAVVIGSPSLPSTGPAVIIGEPSSSTATGGAIQEPEEILLCYGCSIDFHVGNEESQEVVTFDLNPMGGINSIGTRWFVDSYKDTTTVLDLGCLGGYTYSKLITPENVREILGQFTKVTKVILPNLFDPTGLPSGVEYEIKAKVIKGD